LGEGENGDGGNGFGNTRVSFKVLFRDLMSKKRGKKQREKGTLQKKGGWGDDRERETLLMLDEKNKAGNKVDQGPRDRLQWTGTVARRGGVGDVVPVRGNPVRQKVYCGGGKVGGGVEKLETSW